MKALFAALLLLIAIPLRAQDILTLAGVPFTAKILFLDHGQPPQTAALIARASDGSTYEASFDTRGHVYTIHIEDINNHRILELHPSPPSYTYILQEQRRSNTCTPADVRKSLEQAQVLFTKEPKIDSYGTHQIRTALGQKQQNGMTVFGDRVEMAPADGKHMIYERWESDTGITTSTKTTNAANGDVSATALTDLIYTEPDPALFQIPSEYIPGNDPILAANTIYIENRTGEPEVQQFAEKEFRSFRDLPPSPHQPPVHLTLVPTREQADLIAVFHNSPDLDAPFSPIQMQIFPSKGGDAVFTCHYPSSPDLQPRPRTNALDAALAHGCAGQLLMRIVNTHIGPL